MLSIPGSLRVFIALESCYMRAGINTLHALAAATLREDTRTGALFSSSSCRASSPPHGFLALRAACGWLPIFARFQQPAAFAQGSLPGWHGHVTHVQTARTIHVLLAARGGRRPD